MVIAGSFSQTYQRNAINNGFLALEVPELVRDLIKAYGQDALTVITGHKATLNFENSFLSFNGRTYPLSPVGKAVQELVLADGLENWVKERL